MSELRERVLFNTNVKKRPFERFANFCCVLEKIKKERMARKFLFLTYLFTFIYIWYRLFNEDTVITKCWALAGL